MSGQTIELPETKRPKVKGEVVWSLWYTSHLYDTLVILERPVDKLSVGDYVDTRNGRFPPLNKHEVLEKRDRSWIIYPY